MFKSYLAQIGPTGLEFLCRDDASVADYLETSSSTVVGVRAVATEAIADMVRQQLKNGEKRLALATLDAGALELINLGYQ